MVSSGSVGTLATSSMRKLKPTGSLIDLKAGTSPDAFSMIWAPVEPAGPVVPRPGQHPQHRCLGQRPHRRHINPRPARLFPLVLVELTDSPAASVRLAPAGYGGLA